MTNRSWPGTSTNDNVTPSHVGVREAEVDGDAAGLFFLEPIGVGPGQRANQRALAVVDVPRRADDHRPPAHRFRFAARSCAPVAAPAACARPASPSLPNAARGLGSALLRRGPRFSSGLAHAFEDVDQPEIDLAALHVDLDDLDAHLVAEPVDLAGVLAVQDVRLLDEAVVVVGHRRDVHHAFDEVLDQLDVQAEGADAGDVALELVADLVRHEADLLPLHQLALGVGGPTFALGGVARHLGQVFGQLVDAGPRPCGRAGTRATCDARPGLDSGESAR